MGEGLIRVFFEKGMWTLFGTLIAIITYYLKKQDVKIDANEKSIKELEKSYVSKEELDKVEEKLEKKINESNSQIMDKLDKITEKISDISCCNISKKEFIIHNSRVEEKIDKLQEMLISHIKGDK